MAKVVVVEDAEAEEAPAPVTWYNSISSSQIDKWRIWPRMLITLYGVCSIEQLNGLWLFPNQLMLRVPSYLLS